MPPRLPPAWWCRTMKPRLAEDPAFAEAVGATGTCCPESLCHTPNTDQDVDAQDQEQHKRQTRHEFEREASLSCE